MAVEFRLDAEDVVAARLLAVGIRPRLEFALFAAALSAQLAWSLTPYTFFSLPLLVGLTASLGAFRLIQIGRIREAATAAFLRNPTLRQPTAATWDEQGVTIHPSAGLVERVPWAQSRLRENERIVLLLQAGGVVHAIPKRAFADKHAVDAFRAFAKRGQGRLHR